MPTPFPSPNLADRPLRPTDWPRIMGKLWRGFFLLFRAARTARRNGTTTRAVAEAGLRWGRENARVFGLHIDLRNGPPPNGPELLICNHTGYADIFVHAALFPARFVAKAAVAHYPLAGRCFRAGRPILVERERRTAAASAASEIAATLRAGVGVIVYPEGTTSAGADGFLPFKTTAFECAIAAGIPVRPILTYYDPTDGGENVGWYGNVRLLPHFLRFCALKEVKSHVYLLDPSLAGAGGRPQKIRLAGPTGHGRSAFRKESPEGIMKNYSAQCKLGFHRAWENLFDFALPNSWSRRGPELEKAVAAADQTTSQAFFTLLFFPLLGMVAGIVIYVAARLAGMVINEAAAAVLFGIVAALFLEFKDHGRGMVLVIAAMKRRFFGAADEGETRIDELQGALSSSLLTILLLFKMAVLGVLYFRGYGLLIAAVLVADFAVQGELASCPDSTPHGKPIFDVSTDERKLLRLLALFCLFFVSARHLGVFLATAFVAATVAVIAERVSFGRGDLSSRKITFYGSLCNLLVLAIMLALVLGS